MRSESVSGFYEPPPGFASPFRDRLLHPHWDLIQRALGRPVPGILRELYGEPDAVLRGHFRVRPPGGGETRWLDLFFPMDEEALRPYGRVLPAGAIAFADNEHGDPYFFVPDATGYGDGPVYLQVQEEGKELTELVAPSLSEFLGWQRDSTY